jgi:rod shape-determining protein MreD
MVKKLILFGLLFYLLTLFQTSFFPHFIFGLSQKNLNYFFNLSWVLILLLSFFEKKTEKFSFLLALLGGFFSDIFSEKFFGFYTLSFLLSCFFVKNILKKYVQLL